jgi:hypothetical protein
MNYELTVREITKGKVIRSLIIELTENFKGQTSE